MRLVVDVRERALVDGLSFSMRVPEELDVRALDVGDAMLVADGDDEVPVVILERKTLSDLCASIKDGRYREQKARLMDEVTRRGPSCSAAYVLERFTSFGEGMDAAARKCGLSGDALRTVLLDLQFRQGIRVFCTASVEDTAELLHGAWKRHARLFPPASQDAPTPCRSPCSSSPSSLMYTKRNKNITPSTCFRMQLSQIPGVSDRIATSISERWPSWTALFRDVTELRQRQEEKNTEAADAAVVAMFAGVPTVGKKLAGRIHTFLFPAGKVSV